MKFVVKISNSVGQAAWLASVADRNSIRSENLSTRDSSKIETRQITQL
jgi:hypothetical protein